MNTLHGVALATCLAGTLIGTGLARADVRALERVPLPRGATIELVAADVVQDGRAVSIATFRADDDVDSVLSFYRTLWPEEDGGMPGRVEVEIGDWIVVSRLQDGASLALQLRAGSSGPSEGLLSAQRLAAAPIDVDPPPVPPGAQLLSSTSSRDGPRRVTTHVVSSVARPGQLVAFYRDAFDRAGWSLESTGAEGDASVLRVSRRGARAEAVVTRVPDGSSVVVLNEITGGV